MGLINPRDTLPLRLRADHVLNLSGVGDITSNLRSFRLNGTLPIGPYDTDVDLLITASSTVGGVSYTITSSYSDGTSVSPAQQAAIDSAVAGLINGAPGALDTLKELADAIADDATFSTTVINALATKAPLATPQPGVINCQAQFGLRGDVGTTDQTSILQAMDDYARTNGFSGTFLLPAGDIWYTSITWTGGTPTHPYYLSVDDRISFPTLKGAGFGSTRFRRLGSPSNSTGMTWTPSPTQFAAGVTRVQGIRLQDLELYGQGNSFKATTLAANISSNATTVSIAGALAVAGDALGIRLPASQGGHMIWATIQSIAGSSPQVCTIDVRQAIPIAVTTASSPRVILAKQGRLVQFGGARAEGSTINGKIVIDGVRFYESLSGVCLDDTTGIYFDKRCTWQGVTFCIDYGYNVDSVQVIQPDWGSDRAPVTGACTNGSATITNVTTPTSLRPGDSIADLAALPTLNFPENTFITDVTGTTVTVSEPYSGTSGTKTLAIYRGILIANGNNESPFLGLASANTKNAYTDTQIIGGVTGRAEAIAHLGDAGGGPFKFSGYIEACKRAVKSGYSGGTGSGDIKVDAFIEGAQYLTGEAFEDRIGTSRWDLSVKNGGTPTFPMGRFSYFSRWRLTPGWTWGGANLFTVPGFGVPNIPMGVVGEEFSYGFGGGQLGQSDGKDVGGKGLTYTNTSASGGFNSIPWAFISTVQFTLVGAVSINVGGAWFYRGQQKRIELQQDGTGGRVVTFGSGFYKADGTALGAIAAGAAGQAANLIFDCLDGGSKMVLVSGGPGWV